MASTEDRSRRNEVRLPRAGGGAQITGGGAPGAGSSIPAPTAPQNLRLINPVLLFSTEAARAGVTAVWSPPQGLAPDDYLVQYAADAAFASPGARTAARGQLSLGLDDLPVDTDVYVRVAARANKVQGPWSNVATIRTPVDTVPPDPPTAVAWTWQKTGDLLITWTNPASRNLRDVEIRVWSDSGKTVSYTTAYSASGAYTWSLAENLRATSNQPDKAVYIELRARSYGGVFSSVATPATQPTKAPPATPAGLQIDFSGRDAVFRWAAANDAVRWQLTLNATLAGDVAIPEFAYPYAKNRVDNGGAADPTLTYSLVAIDGLGQPSTALTGTATNPVPGAVSITLSGGGLSALGILLGTSNETDLAELPFRVRIYKDAVLYDTIWLTDIIRVIEVSAKGTYTADVTVFDCFNQPSAVTTSSAVALDPLTLAMLREPLAYRDSLGTAPATLKAVLADGQS